MYLYPNQWILVNEIRIFSSGDEIIQTFEIDLIIADTKWIYEPYRIFKSGVKP
jgi:hypothetical protein